MKLGNSIKKIIRVDPETFRVSLQFSDRFRDTVDLSFLFENPRRKPLILEILRGDLFGKCFVESGALAWPNGYELCPDAIRGWMVAQRRRSFTRVAGSVRGPASLSSRKGFARADSSRLG